MSYTELHDLCVCCGMLKVLVLLSLVMPPVSEPEKASDMWSQKAAHALKWCRTHKMDTSMCVLANLQMHSGLERMVVWDFNGDSVLWKMLVSHGCCDMPWSGTESRERAQFSNQDGSHCSSLGHYKIGARGASSWGIGVKYLLHGLDPENSNALSRQVVLHSWEAVPEQAVYPFGTPEGWGCPSIANTHMQRLDGLLKARKRPVLLWMF